ncbi:MAG: LLM class flavin-dependent oxidoreductase [Chloroflexi bacterium]|nr:LLM class flavin-dependent oxidoreductase [Chloroflexota bacterium]
MAEPNDGSAGDGPQFGIYLPNVGWEAAPSPAELAAYAVEAEAGGFDSVWVEDRLLHGELEMLEALTTLTFVAAHTTRVKLGTSVLLVNLRNPLSLAKSLSTLDYLSGGRLVIGASLGGHPPEYDAAGVPMRTRVSRFTDTVRFMRAAWGEEQPGVIPDSAEGLPMLPRPAQAHIPIWFGGRVEAALVRAGTFADGWLASSTTTAEAFRSGWARVRAHATAAGRDPEQLTPAKFCYIHVDDSTERALARLEATLPKYYGRPYDAASFSIYGPPDRCVEQALELLDAGIRTLIFATVTPDRAQLARVAQDVLPGLRKA